MQEGNENGEYHLRYAQAIADKKIDCNENNQHAPVSFLH